MFQGPSFQSRTFITLSSGGHFFGQNRTPDALGVALSTEYHPPDALGAALSEENCPPDALAPQFSIKNRSPDMLAIAFSEENCPPDTDLSTNPPKPSIH